MTKLTNSPSKETLEDVTDIFCDEDREEPATTSTAKKAGIEKTKKVQDEASKRGFSDLIQLLESPVEKKAKKGKVDIVAVVREWTSSMNSLRSKTEQLLESHEEHIKLSTASGRRIGSIKEIAINMFRKVDAVEKKVGELGRLLTASIPPPPTSSSVIATEDEEKVDFESAFDPVAVGAWDVEMENSSPPPPPPKEVRQIACASAGNRQLMPHGQAEDPNYGFGAHNPTDAATIPNLDSFYRIPKKPAAHKVKENLKVVKLASRAICLFCGGSHRSQDCSVFTTAVARMSMLKMRKLCPGCGQHEFDGRCPYNPPMCAHCRGRHQTAVCGKTYR